MNLHTISNDVLVIILKMLPIDTLLAGRLVCPAICKAVDSIQFDEFAKETHESDEERIEVTYKIGPAARYRTITSILIYAPPHNYMFSNRYGSIKKVSEYTVLKLTTSSGITTGPYLYIKGSTAKHMIIVWNYSDISVVSSDSYIDMWDFLLHYRMSSFSPMKRPLHFNRLLEEKIKNIRLPDELYTTVLDYLD